ncbi:MAG: helix-turn-helix domain-containing protein [Polyangiaceae bacterium]|nr:helix-turn-helix domain-containing protein [Polyangiaceae bacterium]
MPFVSKGSLALTEAIDRRGHTRKQAAESLGLDLSRLSRLLSGRRKATLEAARRAEESYGVPAAWFADFVKEAAA